MTAVVWTRCGHLGDARLEHRFAETQRAGGQTGPCPERAMWRVRSRSMSSAAYSRPRRPSPGKLVTSPRLAYAYSVSNLTPSRALAARELSHWPEASVMLTSMRSRH